MDVSIGFGIIVGCSIISLTAIYLFTRNRWNWKRISIYLAVVIFVYFGFTTSIYLIDNKRTKNNIEALKIERDKGFVKNFWGLSFTNTFSDVIYYKGYPAEIHSNENGGIVLDYGVKSENIERWVRFGNRLNSNDANSTNQIDSIHSNVDSDMDFENFGGIRIQDSFSDVQNKFKTQLVEKKLDDLSARRYKIGNISFLFKNNRLEGLYIFNTNRYIDGYGTNWVKIK